MDINNIFLLFACIACINNYFIKNKKYNFLILTILEHFNFKLKMYYN